MDWKRYAAAFLIFNGIGILFVYALQRLQGWLPLNAAGMPAVNPEVALNTAVSFGTNTNWQAYGGETTMSHLTQMLGLTVQNFLSAAVGMAVAVALIRGFTRRLAGGIGNFWVDLVRSTLYVLLPLALVVALFLVWQGVPQTFAGEGDGAAARVDDRGRRHAGDAAGDRARAGGLADRDQAARDQRRRLLQRELRPPAREPDAALELRGGALDPADRRGALLHARRAGPRSAPGLGALRGDVGDLHPAPARVRLRRAGGQSRRSRGLGVDQAASALQAGGNMEGKEVRFGIANSSLWATATTAASNGSVNAMHDSFTPLGGLVPLWLIEFGEVVFGGVGSGLYGMLAFAIVAVFIGGLMVGRTPEYLGKKLEAFEMKMASLVILFPAMVILLGTAIACVVPAGTATLGNPGAHGFSEILYAFSSGAGNNGSAFGGITVSGRFYAVAIAIAMFIGRYWLIVPILAIAGALAAKKGVPATAGTLPTHGPLFVSLLAGTVVLVGALTFFPALALGPIVEHLQLFAK